MATETQTGEMGTGEKLLRLGVGTAITFAIALLAVILAPKIPGIKERL